MNNTDKLLRAFIEASGYEVKDVHTKTYGHPRELKHSERMFGGMSAELEFQGNGMYKEVTRRLDYKITKKASSYIKCNKCETHLAYNSPLDACLCGNSNNLERVG